MQIVEAVQFVRRIGSGRSRPTLMRCEAAQGGPLSDFVVKLRAGLESDIVGLDFEAIGSTLASRLGLSTPDCAQVNVTRELAEAVAMVDQSTAESLGRSLGSNFGSRYLPDASVPGVDGPLPASLRVTALEIFAFDALIANVDRRVSNPNLLQRSAEIYAIDHEAAFAFYYDVFGGTATPWLVAKEDFLRDHVYFRSLRKSGGIDLGRFRKALQSISNSEIQALIDGVPPEWRSERLSIVADRIAVIRDHVDEFIGEIEVVLG